MQQAKPTKRLPQVTRLKLIEAARLEFESPGFEETNSNKIALRAGYAPQTFYRHFADKVDIFLAVYDRWITGELAALDGVRDAGKAAKTLVRQHRASLHMRRTLRHLSTIEPRVRSARAKSRLQQIELMRKTFFHLEAAPQERLAATLLMIERLADACAEREFVDLGISEHAAVAQLERLLDDAIEMNVDR